MNPHAYIPPLPPAVKPRRRLLRRLIGLAMVLLVISPLLTGG